MNDTIRQLEERVQQAADGLSKLRRERTALSRENERLRAEATRTTERQEPAYPAELGPELRELLSDLRGGEPATVSDEGLSHG
jgi:regulator of replication initiation timing